MLFELAFHVGEGELGGVDGDFKFAEEPGQSADVVLMAVSEDNGADVLFVFDEIRNVGNNDVNAEQFRFREHEAGVNHNNVVFPANREAVHAELAEAAERDDLQFFRLHLSGLMLSPGLYLDAARTRAKLFKSM